MSTENVELVKAIFPREVDLVDVVTSETPQVLLDAQDAVSPDLEVEFAASRSGTPALHYRGLAGLLEGWRDWLTPWESYRIEIEDVIDAGARVITLAVVRAKTSRDGVVVEHRPAAVWKLEKGKVVSVHFFLDRPDALEFAGISPHN